MSDISKAAAALGRKGGKKKTAAKAAAARENGKLGGRPPLKSWRIFSSQGSDFGTWRGETASHALSKMHKAAGYSGIKWDRTSDSIIYPDKDTEDLCGNIDAWTVERISR